MFYVCEQKLPAIVNKAIQLNLFPRENLLIIHKILSQKCRNVQLVWAAFEAGTAVYALFNLQHFFLPVRGKPGFGRSAANHLAHAGTLVDCDAD